MKKLNSYKIDWNLVSSGLGLPISSTIEMFNDGRILGRLGEFLHADSNQGKREKENSSFDVKETNKIRSEIRTITNNVSFASSKEIGFGRKVTESGFASKLNSLDRYLLVDKREILSGDISMIEVTKDDLLSLSLGKNKTISSKKFFEIYDRNK